MTNMFQTNVNKKYFLKDAVCSEQDLSYSWPSVHTYTKGLAPTGLMGIFPHVPGYERVRGNGCHGNYTQFDVTAVECAIKCNHDVNCASFVAIATAETTSNPFTYMCYLNKENCTVNAPTLETSVEGVYTYFKTGAWEKSPLFLLT